MSPRPRLPRRMTLAAALVALAVVASACGSSDRASGSVTSLARAEPVSGRQSAGSSAGRSLPTTTPDGATAGGPTPSTAGSTDADEGATDGPPEAAPDENGDEPVVPGVVTGAQALVDDGLTPLLGQRVGVIANRASTVGQTRLIDVLADHPDVDLVAIFAPEHGVEAADVAGSTILDGVDRATGVPIDSLYDDDRAPDAEVLDGLDVIVFDLQDAGARFYTYVSTLGLAMQAAASAGLRFVVLDRPNPLGGDRLDGPLLVDDQRSFVGLYPIPGLHGLTVGELAGAIKGEGWLDGLGDLDLQIVELRGWDRGQRWVDTGLVWTAPSPGLPTAEMAQLYPSTVLLEATTVSFGRGTDRPFGQFGAPWLDAGAMVSRLEAADLPGVVFEAVEFAAEDGDIVPGVRLTLVDEASVRPLATGVHILHHLLAQAGDRPVIDRPRYFDLLAGTASLRRDLVTGRDPAAIVAGWAADLADWENTRAPYLLYPSPAD